MFVFLVQRLPSSVQRCSNIGTDDTKSFFNIKRYEITLELCMSVNDDNKRDSQTTDAELKEALQGKTLQVYLMLLDSPEPIGAREVQRRLDYSSVNVAVHHLKLCRVGLAVKDEYGRYLVS